MGLSLDVTDGMLNILGFCGQFQDGAAYSVPPLQIHYHLRGSVMPGNKNTCSSLDLILENVVSHEVLPLIARLPCFTFPLSWLMV